MKPKSRKKTAILVVHGNGTYDRFQALNEFTNGFINAYCEHCQQNEKALKKRYVLKQRKSIPQSAISIETLTGNIDFYEYFWDTNMNKEITWNEGFEWLRVIAKGAKTKYAKEDSKDSDAKQMNAKVDVKDPVKNKRDLTSRLLDVWEKAKKTSKLIPHLLSRTMQLLAKFPRAMTFILRSVVSPIRKILQIIKGLSPTQSLEFIGADFIRYLSTDPRSEYFENREKTLTGAVDELGALMDDECYDRIIVAAHSLGSVIAVDAINRLILQINSKPEEDKAIEIRKAEKIIGLVTFGSPLDKVTFLLKDYILSVRGQDGKSFSNKLMAHTRAFRSRDKALNIKDIDDPPNYFVFPKVIWLNFWHPVDLASGQIDGYDIAKVPPKHLGKNNYEITDIHLNFLQIGDAHSCYWGKQNGDGKKNVKKNKKLTSQMQKAIIEEFFPPLS